MSLSLPDIGDQLWQLPDTSRRWRSASANLMTLTTPTCVVGTKVYDVLKDAVSPQLRDCSAIPLEDSVRHRLPGSMSAVFQQE